MATIVDAADPRRARCRATAARRIQEDPDRPVFHGNGPDDYVCVECGNVLADVDGPRVHDEARCASAAAAAGPSTSRSPTSRNRGRSQRAPSSASERRAVPRVGGGAVAVERGDPDERRMAHRRRRQVEQRVVVGPLALHAAEAEALRRQAARRARRCARTTRGRARGTRRASKPSAASGGYSSSAVSRNDVKCGGPSTAITVPRRRVHQVDRQQQVLARRAQHRDVALAAARRWRRAPRAPP